MRPSQDTTYLLNIMVGNLGIRQDTVVTHHQLPILIEISTGKDEALRSPFGSMHLSASDACYNKQSDTSAY